MILHLLTQHPPEQQVDRDKKHNDEDPYTFKDDHVPCL